MKEKNEQRHKMVVFNECNVIDAKIDKFTPMLGKLSTQSRNAKLKVYQGRGWPSTNSGRGNQNDNYKNRNRFYDNGRSYDKK